MENIKFVDEKKWQNIFVNNFQWKQQKKINKKKICQQFRR
jgi:hypothetical protein